MNSPGKRFRDAIKSQNPLAIVGTVSAYCALMATKIGHQALYLSGGGCANTSFGLPDLGITSLDNVLEDARRITAATAVPLLVDIDTGFGGAFNIARTIKEMIRADVAAIHMEDQVAQKRCGHRPNKELVSRDEMCDRIKAAVDARTDKDFMLIARTDAIAGEGLPAAIERMHAYVAAGADAIFAEAVIELHDYKTICDTLSVPVLANITEFGKTPLFTREELAEQSVAMVLYPLSAFRAMNKAAENVYQTLLHDSSQATVLDTMQTREELYSYLDYHSYEDKLDQLFKGENNG